MQNILQSRYYNIGEGIEGKYFIQTRSQAKSKGITLQEVHGIGKRLDPNIRPKRQVIKPITASEVKGVTQVKPRLGHCRVGIKWKIKFPVSLPHDEPIVQLKEKTISQQPQNVVQPKMTVKVPVPDSSRIHKFIPVPDYIIPQARSRDDTSSRMIKRKTIQILVGKFQHIQILCIGSLLNQLKYP